MQKVLLRQVLRLCLTLERSSIIIRFFLTSRETVVGSTLIFVAIWTNSSLLLRPISSSFLSRYVRCFALSACWFASSPLAPKGRSPDYPRSERSKTYL